MKKRLFALLLTAALLCTLLPQAALLAGAEEYPTSGTCGEKLFWSFDAATATLTITGSGAMEDYSSLGPWKHFLHDIVHVSLPDGLTTIGDHAFDGVQMTGITVPEGVTSIGDYAFYDCFALESVSLPASLTHIGFSVFRMCQELERVTVNPGSQYFCNVDNVLYDKNMTTLYFFPTDFSGVYVIPNGVTTICSYAFGNFCHLKGIVFPDSLTTVEDRAFDLFGNLESITVGEHNPCYKSINGVLLNKDGTEIILCPAGYPGSYTVPSGVVSIRDHAFSECRDLKTVTITNGVTDIGEHAFSDCFGIKSFSIAESVKHIGTGAFCYCKSLTEITLPSGLTSIADELFCCCDTLPEISIPSKVTSIGSSAFYDCPALKSVTLPAGLTEIVTNAFHNCTSLSAIEIPFGVKSIGDFAFADCTALTSVTVPAGTKQIGKRVFGGCTALTDIYIMNAGCKLFSDNNQTLGVPGTTTVHGYAGSTAQTYAEQYGYTFEALPKEGQTITEIELLNYRAPVGGQTPVTADELSVPDYAAYSVDAVNWMYFPDPENAFAGPWYEEFLDGGLFLADIWVKPDDGCKFADRVSLTVNGETVSDWYVYLDSSSGQVEIMSPKTFAEVGSSTDPCEGYTDIPASCWYRNAAGFVLERGIMSSTTTDSLTFAPNTPCTRSMIAQMLYSLEGKPAVTFEKNFPDVKQTDWFASAVTWAYQNGVVGGYDNGKFGPNDKVTREQMAVILKAYTEKVKKMDTSKTADLSGFADANKATWSKPFIQWAVAEGLLSGKANGGKTYLDPQGNATRAEVAAIMMSFITKVVGE